MRNGINLGLHLCLFSDSNVRFRFLLLLQLLVFLLQFLDLLLEGLRHALAEKSPCFLGVGALPSALPPALPPLLADGSPSL